LLALPSLCSAALSFQGGIFDVGPISHPPREPQELSLKKLDRPKKEKANRSLRTVGPILFYFFAKTGSPL
jgi:hypothetical protein